jgi:twinkle protein
MFESKDGAIVGTSWEEMGVDVPLGRTGQWKTFCPKCHSSRKHQQDRSLSVNMDDGVAVCKNIGCEQRYVVDRLGAVDAVRDRLDGVAEKQYKKPEPQITYDEIDDWASQWFENKRGISLRTLKLAQVTSALDWMPGPARECDTIRFNYFDGDELINIKYRGPQKSFKMHSGAKLIFYNLNAIKDAEIDSIVITEGEIDALAYIESDVTNVMSVPNGAQTGKNNLQYLNNCWEWFDPEVRKKRGLKALKKIVLAVDNDEAGISLRNEFVRRFGAGLCYFVDFGEYKDANELLIEKGKVAVFNTYDKASPVPLVDIKTVDDLMDDIMVLKKTGLHPGIQVGSKEFQRHFSFEGGRLTVLTGVPTHGKSEWLDDTISRLAIFAKWRFGIFSPENYPLELHVAKLVSKLIGKDFNECTDMELSEALSFIRDHFIWIDPEDECTTLDNLLKISDSLVQRYGIDGLIIDPWTEVDTEGRDDTNGVRDSLTKINKYKRRTDVHIFLVAHPTKMQKDDSGRVIVPDLYDVSGSAHFYNKTDGGISIYRDFMKEIVEVHISKIKFKHLGKLGTVQFKWNPRNGRYQDIVEVESEGWDDSNWLHVDTQQAIEYTPTTEEEEGVDRLVKQTELEMNANPSDLPDDLPF